MIGQVTVLLISIERSFTLVPANFQFLGQNTQRLQALLTVFAQFGDLTQLL